MELSGTFTDIHPNDWPEDGTPPEAYPIQQGSFIRDFIDGQCEFQGKWYEITRNITKGFATVATEGRDKLYVLEQAIASYTFNGKTFYTFNKYCGAIDIGAGSATVPVAVRLYPGTYHDETFKDTWFPKYDSEAWFPTAYLASLGYSDTLSQNFTAGATEMRLSKVYKGVPPAGFISVTTGGNEEWFQYDGYTQDQATGYWWLNNLTPAMLGSHAAINHTNGDIAYFRLSRRMHFINPVIIEGVDSTTYTLPEAIADTHYDLQEALSAISFHQEPLSLGARGDDGSGGSGGARIAYGSVWLTGGVFDEDNANGTAIYLGETIKALLEQTIAELGPGFGPDAPETCTVNNNLSPDIPITTLAVVTAGSTVRQVLNGLLQGLGLSRGINNDAILITYDPHQDEININYAVQTDINDSSVMHYSNESKVTKTLNNTNVKSAYLVRSQGNDNLNIFATPRIWHTAIDTTLSGNPLGAQRFGNEYPAYRGWKHSAANFGLGGIFLSLAYPHAYSIGSILGAASYPNLLTDNSDKTGMALMWSADPGDGHYIWFWTPDDATHTDNQHPAPYQAQRFAIAFDMQGTTSTVPNRLLDVQAYGYNDLVPNGASAPTSANGPFGLGTGSRFIMSPGSYDNVNAVIWEFTTDQIINGISLYFRAMPNDDPGVALFGSRPVGFRLLDVAAFGTPTRTDIVQVRKTYSTSDPAGYITAPLTGAKLLDSNMGQHNPGTLDIGPATRATAMHLGTLALVFGWGQSEPQTYTNVSRGMETAGVPVRGRTAVCGDGFSGMIEDFTRRNSRGAISLDLTVRNYRTTLYGDSIRV